MIYKIMPYFIFRRLWGDRRRYGTRVDFNDPDFKSWLSHCVKFYKDTQKGLIGGIVNHFGFKVLKRVPLQDKKVLEIGPGIIEHMEFHQGTPSEYHLVDMKPEFLELSKKVLEPHYDKVFCHENDGYNIPLESNQFDVVMSFNQLEHCIELDDFVKEIQRVLKPGGLFVGSVPTEGSFAWGLGRFLTSRRYVNKNFDFSLDKIICWEHPNFVDTIMKSLKKHFKVKSFRRKPFNFLPLDFNLTLQFIVQKGEDS